MSGLIHVLGFKSIQIEDYINPRGEQNKTQMEWIHGRSPQMLYVVTRARILEYLDLKLVLEKKKERGSK